MRGRRPTWIDAGLAVWTFLVFVFLFAPIVTVVLYSFNRGVLGQQTSSLTGLTTRWYPQAWENTEIRHAVMVSMRVAVISAAISVVIGTVAGFILARGRYAAVRAPLEALIYLLLVVPEIVLAVSLLLFYTKLGITLGIWTLVAAHTPFSIAVVALIVRARLLVIDPATEEASYDLGAGGWRTFWGITLPQARPAILAGFILAFTFSFDDLVISFFLSTPTVTTLPVYLFGTLHLGVRPDVYAIATAMLAFTLTMLAATGAVYAWQSRRLGRARDRGLSLAPQLDAS
jgi:ABC-type spermidine/putrescine transport system permease subunit II